MALAPMIRLRTTRDHLITQLDGCRIALGLLAADCDYMQIRTTTAVLEHLAEHTTGDRATHQAALSELRLIVQALEMDDER